MATEEFGDSESVDSDDSESVDSETSSLGKLPGTSGCGQELPLELRLDRLEKIGAGLDRLEKIAAATPRSATKSLSSTTSLRSMTGTPVPPLLVAWPPVRRHAHVRRRRSSTKEPPMFDPIQTTMATDELRDSESVDSDDSESVDSEASTLGKPPGRQRSSPVESLDVPNPGTKSPVAIMATADF
jgi:hypothetical protein